MMCKICSYPDKQCSFHCGTAGTALLVRKDDAREIDGVIIDDADGYTYGAYHWEEKAVPLCSNRELCPFWKTTTSQHIMNMSYADELYICDQIEKIVFREDPLSEESMFMLGEWFRCLRKKIECNKYFTEKYIEKFKARLKDRYNLWKENRRLLGLTV